MAAADACDLAAVSFWIVVLTLNGHGVGTVIRVLCDKLSALNHEEQDFVDVFIRLRVTLSMSANAWLTCLRINPQPDMD